MFVPDQAAQDKVRDKAVGCGLLYPDTFSEERLTFLPPASSALLVLFSRNHNVRLHLLRHVYMSHHPCVLTVYRRQVTQNQREGSLV